MALSNWTNTVTQWHTNPDNVRDPTCIYNNVGLVYNGPIAGYVGTPYAFDPINFEPSVYGSTPLDHNVPYKWKQIPLDQFGVADTAKIARITLNSGFSGPPMWNRVAYAWFRRPGCNWNLSPIFNGGYLTCLAVDAPVGPVTKADGTVVPGIEVAWGINSLNGSAIDTTNWGTGAPVNELASLVGILSGWGE